MKRVTTAFLLVFVHVLSFGQFATPGTGTPIGDIVETSRKVRDMAQAASNPASSPTSNQSVDIATEIAGRAPRGPLVQSTGSEPDAMRRAADAAKSIGLPPLGRHLPGGGLTKEAAQQGPEVYVFISQSQTDADIKDALEAAVSNNASVYLRGILPGSKLATGALRVQRIAGAMQAQPRLSIDPRPFERFSVTTVPTIVVARGINEFVKVTGTLSVRYALDRLNDNRTGDLGSLGSTLEIVEPDLIEDFKSRIMGVDWEAKKAAAVQRMFHSMNIVSLPKAKESGTRLVDPTIVLENTIAIPGGQVLAAAGSTFNPLKAFGLSRQIVVFDATDKAQMAFAKKLADEELSANRIALLITTEVDRDKGMDSYKELSLALRPHKLFFLDDAVKQRLGVRVVPSVAKRDGDMLRVTEVGPEKLQ